ncbi:MAG TPA: hypothetical protein VD771_00095 [Gemmatimonadaceae bacterium]|nr:hypothetical protein [Gemmatimonadaceae bacterium]
MIRIRRFAVALALAGVLGTSLALSPTPLSASPTGTVPAVSVTVFCGHLAQAIAFLESRPQTPLRDFLLATLRKAEVRYCE